jgi:hypothetical protein
MWKKYFFVCYIFISLIGCGKNSGAKSTSINDAVISSNNEIIVNGSEVNSLEMTPDSILLKIENNEMFSAKEFVEIIKNSLFSEQIPFSATDTVHGFGFNRCDNTPVEFQYKLAKLSAFPKNFSLRVYGFCSYITLVKGTKFDEFPLIIDLFAGAGSGGNTLVFALYDTLGVEKNSAILVTESYTFLPTAYDVPDEELISKGWTFNFYNDTIDVIVYKSYNYDYYDLSAIQDPEAKKERRIFHISDNGKVKLVKREVL